MGAIIPRGRTDESREVSNRRHNPLNHSPSKSATRFLSWLMHNGSDAFSSDDGPNEEGDASWRHEVSFDSKEMANFVDWEPDGRQTAQPEKKEADKIHGVSP